MKGKNENAEVLLWIVLVVALAGLGWFGYKYYLKKKLQKNMAPKHLENKTPQQVQSEVASEDPEEPVTLSEADIQKLKNQLMAVEKKLNDNAWLKPKSDTLKNSGIGILYKTEPWYSRLGTSANFGPLHAQIYPQLTFGEKNILVTELRKLADANSDSTTRKTLRYMANEVEAEVLQFRIDNKV